MKTHTQYYTDKPEIVERKIITLGEARNMSLETINAHFECVAKLNSFHHNIMIEQPVRPDVAKGHTFWDKRKEKRIAKRYRKPGRC